MAADDPVVVDMYRIAVTGSTGSGKTTCARRLAQITGAPHIELDALFWEPGWKQASVEVFRSRVASAVAGDRWVTDGNYAAVRDLYMKSATKVVWLDFGLPLVLRRLTRRTFARLIDHEVLFSSNRERWRELVNPEHPIWWAIRTHADRRRRYEKSMDERWVRLRNPRELETWLSKLAAPTAR